MEEPITKMIEDLVEVIARVRSHHEQKRLLVKTIQRVTRQLNELYDREYFGNVFPMPSKLKEEVLPIAQTA